MLRSTRKRIEALEKAFAKEPQVSTGTITMIQGAEQRISMLRLDLNRIGAEVQKLLLMPGLQEVKEVPPQTIPGTPARYELKKAAK